MSNQSNISAFRKELDQASKSLEEGVLLVTKEYATQLHHYLARFTPVDTGRARLSWDVKEDEPSDYDPGEKPFGEDFNIFTADAPPIAAPGNLGSKKEIDLAELTGEKIVYITSAVHYVEYLDEGSSQQSPAGIRPPALPSANLEFDSKIPAIRAKIGG